MTHHQWRHNNGHLAIAVVAIVASLNVSWDTALSFPEYFNTAEAATSRAACTLHFHPEALTPHARRSRGGSAGISGVLTGTLVCIMQKGSKKFQK